MNDVGVSFAQLIFDILISEQKWFCSWSCNWLVFVLVISGKNWRLVLEEFGKDVDLTFIQRSPKVCC